jgi:hypothetical protein
MKYITEAKKAVLALERDLQEFLTNAVREGAYDDVAEIAVLAGSLREMMARLSIAPTKVNIESLEVLPPPAKVRPRGITRAIAESNRGAGSQYPKFLRDGDRLIKLGWSKKDKREYEHKASVDVCKAVCFHLADAAEGQVFRMEDFFPITSADGQEIPTYQSYLVLAWLRSLSLIERTAKDGYRWTADPFDEAAFAKAWSKTHTRGDLQGNTRNE